MKSNTRRGKEGSKHGRRVLFQICRNCIKSNAPDNDFKDYRLRQVNQGKVRIKASVSTMGKPAEIIYHCLINGEIYEYPGKYRRKFTEDTIVRPYYERIGNVLCIFIHCCILRGVECP